MRKRISSIIIALVIVIGLSLLLYPTVSDFLRGLAYRRAISAYAAGVEQLDDESYEELLEAARAYNERLAQRLAKDGGLMVDLTEEQKPEYYSLLKTGTSDVMAYVTVPKVNIALPIYHGVSDAVLQSGVGHLEGSSLPVGGPSTHSVLSAHTGLPSAKLFTSIDRLEEGDTFSVQVLRDTLTYQVDQILVVLPNETDALRIEPEADYCTLLTCTPYGINTHRLLVRGHRIPTPPVEEEERPSVIAGLGLDLGDIGVYVLAGALGLLIVMVLVVVILIKRQQMWKRAKRLKRK